MAKLYQRKMNKAEILSFFTILRDDNPNPTTELIYSTPFELLVAVLLSAQATDKGVNKATIPMFKVANTPEAIAALGVDGIKSYIKTIGLFNTKAENLYKTCQILVEKFDSVIPENRLCIGCTKCIQACPVDAIVGTKKKMHTVIQSECTGCDLCIPPCPLDCIYIKPSEEEYFPETGLSDMQKVRADKSRARHQARQKRGENRTTITKTLPPQEKVLANRSSDSDMLSLIAMAKAKTQAKHQERE